MRINLHSSLMCMVFAGVAATACDRRNPVWDASVSNPGITALKSSAVIIDSGADRALVLQVEADLSLSVNPVPIGKNIPEKGVAPTADRTRLAVLCRGVVPQKTAKDPGPALLILGGEKPEVQARYELSDPLSMLTMDPASRYAIISADTSDGSFVSNPNELIIADLANPPAAQNPVALTLRSFGGRPQRLDFTEPLDLPMGTKRLLIAQTDRDVALLDLEDPTRTEITVRLTSGTTRLEPVRFAVSNGEPDRNDDARLAIQLARDPDVVVVDLLPPTEDTPGAPFRPVPNIIGVGGIASDIAFVHTDGGLRLAALVPSTNSLVLIEPTKGVTTSIVLPGAFQRISLITSEAKLPDETALLWSSSRGVIGFLSLGKTSGKPYKSIEELPLPEPIQEVLPVPEPFAYRKILVSASGNSFYILDLQTRKIAPLSSNRAHVMVAPDGQRAWAYNPSLKDLAAINLENAHPQNLLLPYPVIGLADIARKDGGRALIALHREGGLSTTTLNAAAPSMITSREENALSLEGLP